MADKYYRRCSVCGELYNVSWRRAGYKEYICADCANEIIRAELHRKTARRIYDRTDSEGQPLATVRA